MSQRAQQALQFFQDKGWTKTQAAGFVGRMQQESGQDLDPMAVGDGNSSFGAAQWHLDRWDNLKSFTAAMPGGDTHFGNQLEFYQHELETSEKAAADRMRLATTPEDAAAAAMGFERPQGWTAENPSAGHGYSNTVANTRAMAGAEGLPMDAAAPGPTGTPIFDGSAPYASSAPTDPFTDQEIMRQKAEADARAPKGYGFWEAIGASERTDWTSAWGVRELGGRAVDLNYEMSFDTFKEATKDIPEQFHEYVGEAHSADDLAYRIQNAKDDAEREGRLQAMGWTGTGIRLATSIFDPTMLAAGIATDGLAAPAIAAMKVGRAGRILLEGLSVGTSNAALTAGATLYDPRLDTSDVFAAFGTGMFLGGTIGSLRHNPALEEEANIMARAGRNMQNSSLGAAAADGSIIPREQLNLLDGERPDLIDAPTAAFGKVRFDIGGQTGSSESLMSRTLAPYFGEEAVGHKGHGVVPDSMTTVQRAIHGRAMRNWNTIAYPTFKKWAQEQGEWSYLKRGKAWDRFVKEIGNGVENTGLDDTINPHVQKVIGEFRKITGDYAEQITNPLRDRGGSARPIAEVEPDKFYFPKYADHESINTLVEEHGQDNLIAHVKRAVLSKRPDMKDELADRISKGWFENIVKAGYGMEDTASLAVAQADRETLKKAFAGTTLTDDELEAAFDVVDSLKKPKTENNAGFSRTKRRTLLDYTYESQINGKTVSMKDFFQQDADFVMNRYSRQTSGRIALAQSRPKNSAGEIIVDGIYGPSDMGKVLKWIKDDWASMRVDRKGNKMSQARKEAGAALDTENFQFLYDAITGTPHYDTRAATFQWMRRAREFNFVRLMGRLGFNQAQEVARMFGTLGMKAVLQHIPSFGRMLDEAGRSIPKERLLQEIEAFSGRFSDMDFARHRYRYEDSLVGTKNYGRIGRGTDRLLETGKRITADISLMTHIHGMQQRGTVAAVSQRLYDMARKTLTATGKHDLEKLKGKDLFKLRAIGMADEDLQKVFSHMLKHGETPSGSRLVALNLDKWKPEVRARFINSMHRWTDRIIHLNDVATMHRWMSKPLVQMMAQFRTFMLGSWAKSTLYNAHHFDSRTFATMMWEMVAGSATWGLTQTAANAFTPEKLKDKLTVANLAKAGFARAGWTSLLPAIADSALMFTPAGAQFDFRSSGTPMDAVFGNSTADLEESIRHFLVGAQGAAIHGRPMTQSEIANGARALPFSNWLPFSAVLAWMIKDQPKSAPK